MGTVLVGEIDTRELRAELADVINAAGMRDQITFVTSSGARVAAVVSVAVAEAATEDNQVARGGDPRGGLPRTSRSTRTGEAPPA